eukprot:gnl/TRDRNA2_/TRDRNA2_69157_c0_seq1.p1 gnl/TRDRNA2_/TRDRNA2_69157_c0~~gnl/TRDRNA2_/TRDRNA2_69157_c0_seq1.p1  ORF type:complete len:268 (-),score=48.43 gnl/TRDRNA2_/TRDRNA2_69157_c0_seq1:18-779(-)
MAGEVARASTSKHSMRSLSQAVGHIDASVPPPQLQAVKAAKAESAALMPALSDGLGTKEAGALGDIRDQIQNFVLESRQQMADLRAEIAELRSQQSASAQMNGMNGAAHEAPAVPTPPIPEPQKVTHENATVQTSARASQNEGAQAPVQGLEGVRDQIQNFIAQAQRQMEQGTADFEASKRALQELTSQSLEQIQQAKRAVEKATSDQDVARQEMERRAGEVDTVLQNIQAYSSHMGSARRSGSVPCLERSLN